MRSALHPSWPLATFSLRPVVTDSLCTAPPGRDGSPCRGKGACIWGSVLHSWRGEVPAGGRTPVEVPKTLEGCGWFPSLSCHTAPPTWETAQKNRGLKGLAKWNISPEGGILQRAKTNREQNRNIFKKGSKGNRQKLKLSQEENSKTFTALKRLIWKENGKNL